MGSVTVHKKEKNTTIHFLLPVLDHPRPNTTEHGIIHVEVESKTWTDLYEGTEIVTRGGLSTSSSLTHSFTILCASWTLLTTRNPSPHLIVQISKACTIQKELESSDHRTPTRYVLRSLKKDIKANRIHGLTTVASPGFFGNASRDQPETNGRYGGKKTIRTP